jgi:hypothetical protein
VSSLSATAAHPLSTIGANRRNCSWYLANFSALSIKPKVTPSLDRPKYISHRKLKNGRCCEFNTLDPDTTSAVTKRIITLHRNYASLHDSCKPVNSICTRLSTCSAKSSVLRKRSIQGGSAARSRLGISQRFLLSSVVFLGKEVKARRVTTWATNLARDFDDAHGFLPLAFRRLELSRKQL